MLRYLLTALIVYDVANRETFDALPRWYSELETHVSESVVKIVVGNKVDKVVDPSFTLLPAAHSAIFRSSHVKYPQKKAPLLHPG